MNRSSNDAAAVRVLPPLVPVAAVLAGIGLDRLWPIEVEPPFGTVGLWSNLGGGLCLLALLMVVWALVVIKRSGQNPHPRTATPTLLEQGPFRMSRNPIYLGMVLLCLGFGIRKLNPWLLVLTPVVLLVLQSWVIVPEERYLESKFGSRYRDYKRRVRRWL